MRLLELSKLTGDSFRHVVTIPPPPKDSKGGLSLKIREAPPTTPMSERDNSASRKNTGQASWRRREGSTEKHTRLCLNASARVLSSPKHVRGASVFAEAH